LLFETIVNTVHKAAPNTQSRSTLHRRIVPTLRLAGYPPADSLLKSAQGVLPVWRLERARSAKYAQGVRRRPECRRGEVFKRPAHRATPSLLSDPAYRTPR
jgi:hypothetical protein